MSVPAFGGFQPEAIQFLVDLADHNDRAWFQPRKAEFERLLKEPMEALVAALDERFSARRIPLRADPRRSIFRIYRDTRFSKDKSPYKTNVGASIPWVEGVSGADDVVHGNDAYFHFAPGNMFAGGGMWCRTGPAWMRSGVPWSRSRTGCSQQSRTRGSSRGSGL